MTTQPLHNHDCDACAFLGSFNGADLYLCKAYHQRSGGCVVVRYSSDCSDNICWNFANIERIGLMNIANSEISEAYYRAVKLQKEGSAN